MTVTRRTLISFLADSCPVWRIQRPRTSGGGSTPRNTSWPVRALSLVDLLVCGIAANHGLVVLHDDADYELAERVLPDVRTSRVVNV